MESTTPRFFGPPAHDQRGKHQIVGQLSAPKGLGTLSDFKKLKHKFLAKDKRGNLVYLADSKFSLELTQQKYSSLKFHQKSEF